MSTPPPIKEKAYRLERSAFLTPFIPGFVFLLAGTAMVFLPASVVLKILGAAVMLAALWLVMQGLDGRATFRCNQKGLWKDAFVSSTRIYWPVVKSASLKENKYPSFLGKMLGNVIIQISTSDNRLHNLAIPVYFGKMTLSQRDFKAFKRQLATILTMMGAKLK